MEQSTAYRSPYRNKTVEKEIQIPKFFKKLIRQTIYCTLILCTLIIANNVEAVRKTSLWQNMVYLLGYDIDLEETRQTFNNALAYIKEKMPQTENEETQNTQETDEAMQMQIDVTDIKNITKVLRPVSGAATSRFGKRINQNGIEEKHTGVDLEAEIGTPVRASIAGKVIEVKELTDSFGKFIRIQNGDIITTYAHCSSIEVNVGEEVNQGAVIAYSGDTGNVTGPHLHFEITKNGRYVDPGFLLTYE